MKKIKSKILKIIFLVILIFLINGCHTYRDTYAARPDLPKKYQGDLEYTTFDSLFYIRIGCFQSIDHQSYLVSLKYLMKQKMKVNSLSFVICDNKDTLQYNEIKDEDYKTYKNFDNIPDIYKYTGNENDYLNDTLNKKYILSLRFEFSKKIKPNTEYSKEIDLLIKTKLVDEDTKDTVLFEKKYKYYKYIEKGPMWL